MAHVFKTTLHIPRHAAEVFPFFAEAANLERITPPELCFHIVSPQPIRIQQGTCIDYRLRLFGIPFPWRAEITEFEPPHRFVDEQILGPYALWVHTHLFTARNGGVDIVDEVRYRLPFWPFGEVIHPLIAALIRRIFRYRERAILKALR